MSKKATIKKVDDASWLVIDRKEVMLVLHYRKMCKVTTSTASDIQEKFQNDRAVEKYFGARVQKKLLKMLFS